MVKIWRDGPVVSRQLAWQRKKVAEGKCQRCGGPREKGLKSQCRSCLALLRVRARSGKAVKIYRCSQCKEEGHDFRTCPKIARDS